MEPAPVGVEDDLGIGGGAFRTGALARTLLDGERGMHLGIHSARLLGLNGDEEGEGDGSS